MVDSTTKDKYIASSNAGKEVISIKKFISEFNIVPRVFNLIDIYCDNNGSIAQAKKHKSHQ